MNGADVTIVQGAWDPATNGPLAVRCLWITNGAVFKGFTLRGGATRPFSSLGGSGGLSRVGGGVYGATTNGLVADCVLSGNVAGNDGGGAYATTLSTCTLLGNLQWGPQLTDFYHLTATSPCRNAGSPGPVSSDLDIDGQNWAAPPPIGCDEVWEDAIRGPLSVSIFAVMSRAVINHNVHFTATSEGRASRFAWDFGDGTGLTNQSLLQTVHAWTNTGQFQVTFTAFNADHPDGVSTNVNITVIPLEIPSLSAGALNGTNFTLTLPSQPGITYYLEQTTDLSSPIVWRNVQNRVGSSDPLTLTDTRATNQMRFYRVRVQETSRSCASGHARNSEPAPAFSGSPSSVQIPAAFRGYPEI